MIGFDDNAGCDVIATGARCDAIGLLVGVTLAGNAVPRTAGAHDAEVDHGEGWHAGDAF
jgi:hypothetical protein